ATNAARVTNRDRMIPRLAKVFLTRTRAEWTEALRARGVPCGAIQDVVEALRDPQVRDRGMVREFSHPDLGALSLVSCPINYSGSPTTSPTPPPALGQHTEEVLGDLLGLDKASIQSLKACGVI
ncbi:MAG: CoA transferase, partial [Alphaproteobacteria bacterium]